VLMPEQELGAAADASAFLRRLIPPDDDTPRRAVQITTATITRSVARLDLLAAGRAGKLGLIKKYTLDPESGKVSLELYDAQAALSKIGEHHGLWGKGSDILKLIDLSKLSPEQLERIAKGDDPLAVLLDK
jgi:hypothetical protein